MSRRGTSGGSGLTAALLLSIPLAIGTITAVWGLARSPLEAARPPEPVIAAVGSAQRADATRTTAIYRPAETFAVTTQSMGTITDLSIAVSVPVENASIAMKVDGKPVYAYVASAPLYQDISRGSTGEDVATAQQLLHDLGYLDTVDGRAGYATERAIIEFNKGQGYGDNNPVLAASSLLWVPQGSGAPATVAVRVGKNLTPGVDLYTTTTGAAWFDLGIEASQQDRMVTADDVTVALDPGTGRIIDPDSVAKLAALLGGSTTLPVSIVLAEPRTVGTIPASAIVTDADGTMCFFSGPNGAAIRVDGQAGSSGLVDVDADRIGEPVLVNPRDVKVALTCGS